MKVYISLILLISSMAFADGQVWTCEAQGVQNMGGPVGDIWQSVSAQGSSEIEATDRAQEECSLEGLDQCMVYRCFQN